MANWQEMLRATIGTHADAIAAVFRTPVFVTVVVRTPGLPEQEVVVSADPDLDAVIATLQRSQTQERIDGATHG